MYKTPSKLTIPPLRVFRRLFWAQKSDHARLKREFKSFRIELEDLEARSPQPDTSWAQAARDQLDEVEHYLGEHKDVEGGWVCLHAAKRHAVHGLDPTEIAIQASTLCAEATKFSSWRADQIKKLLSVENKQLTASLIIKAMDLRDEYYSNQYHKIWLTGDQIFTLLVITAVGLLLLAPFVVFSSLYPEYTFAPWGYHMVTAVLFFGLLGAAISAAGSLMSATAAAIKIPERVANRFVTISRALFGAGVGLAGYAFYKSKVLEIHFGAEGDGPSGALAVAFLFGFAGERLIVRVLGSLGSTGLSKDEAKNS